MSLIGCLLPVGVLFKALKSFFWKNKDITNITLNTLLIHLLSFLACCWSYLRLRLEHSFSWDLWFSCSISPQSRNIDFCHYTHHWTYIFFPSPVRTINWPTFQEGKADVLQGWPKFSSPRHRQIRNNL